MYDYSLCPNQTILCLDLVSFFASVSCVKLGYDPLRTKLAVVSDTTRPGSVVLAATRPLKNMGIKQGSRLYQIANMPDVHIVNPMMETYIRCSNYISKIILKYVPPEFYHQYSIDECFFQIDSVLHLFADSPREFAKKIQQEIYDASRISSTVGIGKNMLMSKIALDVESKYNADGIAEWNYDDVPTKFWSIRPLSKFWGISTKTEAKLNRKGIHTIGDLAHYPLKYLQQEFGVLGTDLHLHSHGIDFSCISDTYIPKSTSIGKSQILMRDYQIEEIPVILLEQIEEVCYRMRMQNKLARTVQFSIGYSKEYQGGFRKNVTFDRATNITMDIYNICLKYLLQLHTGEPIRSISIALTNLVDEGEEQISLFDDLKKREQQMKLTKALDEIRTRFGKNSVLRAVSYMPHSTIKYRNQLIGGHRA
ncbi:Y-family DNA polymerase [Bacillus sp. JJ1127]|uniref:Y-family DNA polymerase n=1 Tax=Bacillus sp. JJ1127 TaxID=3122952 RepID=UPI002FFE2CDC